MSLYETLLGLPIGGQAQMPGAADPMAGLVDQGPAQLPGQASRPSVLDRLLDPEIALPMAAAFMGQNGNMRNLSNAFGAAGQAMGQKAKDSKTYKFFQQNAPEFAQMMDGGMPVDQAWQQYTKQRFAQTSDPWKVVDGQLFNTQTEKFLRPPNGASNGGFRFGGSSVEAQSLNGLIDSGQITPEQAQQLGAGKTITNPADGSIIFMTPQGLVGQPAGGGQPQPISSPGGGGGGDPLPNGGGIPITGAKPPPKPTESENRNRQLYSVAAAELPIVEENFDSLAEIPNQLMGGIPGSNYMTSEKYQRATNSLKTIVATYLYSTSGATANPGEVENQIAVLTPRPGESKASVADKKRRVRTMVEAIKMATGNAAPAGGDVIDWKDL